MKALLVLFFLFISLLQASGVENFYTVSKAGYTIKPGDSLQLSDPQYAHHQSGIARYKELISRVFLEVREEDRGLLDSNWSATIDVSVSYIDTAGVTVENLPISLNVDFKTGLTAYNRKDVFQVENAHFIKYKIEAISDTALLRFLRLGLEIGAERYYNFNANSSISNLSHTLVKSTNELELTWTPILGAETYELSWFWIDSYLEDGNSKSTSQLTASFKNNASRIVTSESTYRLPLAYDRGFIVYRVRPIGIAGENFEYLVRGQWTAPNHDKEFIVTNTLHKWRIVNGHDINLNYKYSAVFNEKGNRLDAIAYLDGLFKTRQTVQGLKEANGTLISESMYDYEGRPAITILPASGDKILKYHHNFNVSQGQINYSASDFDLDTSISIISTLPLDNSSGSGRYYSTNNPDKAAHNGYLPTSEGYPFSQTVYTPDNTGRIAATGSTGLDLQIGNGHEVKHYYSKPFPVEIDRLFGNEVGYSSRYNKTVSVDPNGVKHISYSDGSGRIIATAIGSAVAPNLLPIDLETDTVQADLLDNNQWFMEKMEEVATQPLVVTDSGTFFFRFHIRTPQFNYSCDSSTFCFNVNYEVRLSVLNEQGQEVIPGGYLAFELGNSNASVYNCDGLTDTSLSFQLQLQPGQYTISKRLILDKMAIAEFVDSIVGICTPSVDALLLSPDISGCETNCEKCELMLADKSQFISDGGTESQWTELSDMCDLLCDTLSICGTYYDMMLQDVSPGGYYGGIWNENGVVSLGDYPFSVYNQLNQLGSGQLDWRNPATPYQDPNGINDSVLLEDEQLYAPEDLPSIEQFISFWKPSWAKSLIQYHPEYCFYQRCTEFEEYRAYESIIFNAFSFQEALNAGYMNPLGITDTSVIPPTLLTSLYQDLLFQSGEAGAPYLDSMLVWIANYNHSELTLWEFTGMVSGCSACDSQCDTLSFGDTSQLNTATLNQQWLLFRTHYLSLRNKVLDLLEAQWQLDNSCFNNCFDKKNANTVVSTYDPTIIQHAPDSIQPKPYDLEDGLVFYDSLVIVDSTCFYMNSVSSSPGPGPGTPLPSDNPSNVILVGQLGSFIQPNSTPDTCVCSTMEDLFQSFSAPNDLVAFAAHYDSVLGTNLTTQQVIDILYACRGEEHFSSSSNPSDNRCIFDSPSNHIPVYHANCDSALSSFEDQCASTCANYIPYWRQELSSCISDSTVMYNLLERMVAICSSGCDPLHPMGSSSTPPSVFTTFGDSSIQQLIQENSGCNPFILSLPLPYEYKLANSVQGQIDSCACTNINAAFSAYPDPLDLIGFTQLYTTTKKLSLSVSEIKTFLCICNNSVDSSQLCDPNAELTLMVSNEIRCDYCVDCSVIENKLQQFSIKFPTLPISYQNASLIQNYLNTELKFNLGFNSYIGLMDSTMIVCKNQIADICNMPLFPDLPIDSSCYTDAQLFAQQDAEYSQQHYKDSLEELVLLQLMNQGMTGPYELFDMTYILREGYYTLYYYDRAGNLERTVPPKGVHIIKDTSLLSAVGLHRKAPQTNPAIYPGHTLSSRYLFNSYSGISVTLTPDGDKTSFWHDRLGRVIASQLANQTLGDNYNYTLFDGLGRKIESGEITDNSQLSITDDLSETDFSVWIADGKKGHFTKTYFDSVAYVVDNLAQNNLRNRVSSIEKFDLRSGAFFRTHYTYDTQGNVNAVVQENTLIPTPHRFKKTEYTYDIIGGSIHEVIYQEDQKDQFLHRYFYDKDNNLTTTQTSQDGFEWEEDASYSYYQHGSLARIVLGDQYVQGLDYAYTIQGWLKAINSGTLSASHDMGMDGDLNLPGNPHQYIGRDVLGFILQYHGSDYTPINGFIQHLTTTSGSSLATNSGELYNGNIPFTILNKQNEPILGKSYRYDVLNRIRSSDIYTNFDSLSTSWLSGGTISQEFGSTYQYDLNGNFMSLKRNGTQDTSLSMDDLEYHYYPNSNKLDHVEDAVGSSQYSLDIDNQLPSNYRYDPSGNLVFDRDEGIRYTWTSLGKVERVIRTGNLNRPNLSFYYDASDNRVMKEIEGDSTLWYVYGADNSLMAIYKVKGTALQKRPDVSATTTSTSGIKTLGEDSYHDLPDGLLNYSSPIQLVEYPLYGSQKLGTYAADRLIELSPNDSAASDTSHLHFVRGHKRYTMKDHINNVQMVISDKNKGVDVNNDSIVDYYNAVVVNSTDYYPFGLEMPVSNNTNQLYRYGFQGQEKDTELKGKGNAVNYTFRMHDPRLGRFFAVDPLSPKYPSIAPYVFSENRVMDAVELEGLELFPIHGTWGSNEGWTKDLMGQLIGIFGNDSYKLRGGHGKENSSWSGGNADKYRRKAAVKMVKYIKQNMQNGEPITIASHSHGGNIAILVFNMLVKDSDFDGLVLNLLTMNTPVREYQLSENALKRVNHYHIYNEEDNVQNKGGDRFKKAFFSDGKKKLMGVLPTGELGPAGRTFDSAENIQYETVVDGINGNHQSWARPNISAWIVKLRQKVNKTTEKQKDESNYLIEEPKFLKY